MHRVLAITALAVLAALVCPRAAVAQRGGADKPTPCELISQPTTRVSFDSVPGNATQVIDKHVSPTSHVPPSVHGQLSLPTAQSCPRGNRAGV